jgi:hypothetical protein
MSFLVGSLFGGGAAAGATAAAAGGGFSLGSILSGVTTIFSVLAGVQESNAEADNLVTQAHEAEFDEKDEQASGLQSTEALKQELNRALGENDVAFAAAGIDLGYGIAAQGRAKAEQDAATQIDIDRSTTDARRAMLRARAAGFYRSADDVRAAGGLKAIGGLLGAFA